jgi:hypothetical protein
MLSIKPWNRFKCLGYTAEENIGKLSAEKLADIATELS